MVTTRISSLVVSRRLFQAVASIHSRFNLDAYTRIHNHLCSWMLRCADFSKNTRKHIQVSNNKVKCMGFYEGRDVVCERVILAPEFS